MSNYTTPKRLNELDDVSGTITENSLYLVQDAVGNRLGVVRALDIVGKTTLDDIQDGTTYQRISLVEKTEITDIRTDLTSHETDFTNPHIVTKDQIGLGNVDNTSDLAKPISTATLAALADKADDDHTHPALEVVTVSAGDNVTVTETTPVEGQRNYEIDANITPLVEGGNIDIEEFGGNMIVTSEAPRRNYFINSNFMINQDSNVTTDGTTATASLDAGEYGHDMIKAITPSAIYQITESTRALTLIGGIIGQRNDDLIGISGEIVTISIKSGELTVGATAGSDGSTVTPGWPHTFELNMDEGAFVTFTAATNVTGIKIETGSYATEYEIPEPRAEEARCYYYYQKYNWSTAGKTVGSGYGSEVLSNTYIYVTLDLRSKIKSTAALSGIGTSYIRNIYNDSQTVTSVSLESLSDAQDKAFVEFKSTGALATDSHFGIIFVTGDYYLEFDARY
jgi:hypothetical protein